MKKLVLSLALPLALFANSCKNCENVAGPDLMHFGSGFLLNTLKDGLSNPNPAFLAMNIAGEFLNQAEELSGKCGCAAGTEIVDRQACNWKIYSLDEGFRPLDVLKNLDIDKSNLLACARDMTDLNYDFEKGNSFLLSNILDFTEIVSERNEDNNDKEEGNEPRGPRTASEIFEYEKAKYGNNFKYQIIHIDMDGNVFNVDEATGKMTALAVN